MFSWFGRLRWSTRFLAIVIVLMLINSIVSYRATQILNNNGLLVSHTRSTILEIERVLSCVKDAETGQRGYLITGDESYLLPYQQSIGETNRHLHELRRLVKTGAATLEKLSRAQTIIEAKFSELDRVIQVRREQGFSAARAIVAEGSGKRWMDQIRQILGEWDEPLRVELQAREDERRHSAQTAMVTLLVSGFSNIVLVAMVAEGVRRDAKLRARADQETRYRAHVQETNDTLQKVNTSLEETTRRLTISNGELEDFASVASHDLQEPLRKIQAFGDRLRVKAAGRLGADGEDYLARMQHAAGRMQVLINDLLAFSRVTSRGKPFEQVDLNTILSDVLLDMESRVEQNSAEVRVADLPKIDADPSQMRQLFQNLLANAMKFRREGVNPVISVDWKLIPKSDQEAREMCMIAVTDNGIGFDEKYLDRIFTIFQRLHGRGTYEGTGVGLAICRKIIERHRGTITARSQPDQGATFEIRLPMNQPSFAANDSSYGEIVTPTDTMPRPRAAAAQGDPNSVAAGNR